MALFTLEELEAEEAANPMTPPGGRSLTTAFISPTVLAPKVSRKSLAEMLPLAEVKDGQTWHLVSATKWNTHDLVEHLQLVTGPADFWMATWSLSDSGTSRIATMFHDGRIRSVRVLVNPKTLIQNDAAAAVLRDISTDFGAYPNHGKVYLLDGDRAAATVLTSANLTDNPRIEAATVTFSKSVAAFHTQWIAAALKRADPFLLAKRGRVMDPTKGP